MRAKMWSWFARPTGSKRRRGFPAPIALMFMLRAIPMFRAFSSPHARARRSEEHTSELQSLMRSSYAVFCLKKKKTTKRTQKQDLMKDTKKEDNKNNASN